MDSCSLQFTCFEETMMLKINWFFFFKDYTEHDNS